jgi:hypothetical protein
MRSDRRLSAAAEVKLERGNDWGVILGWCQESDRQDGAITGANLESANGKTPNGGCGVRTSESKRTSGNRYDRVLGLKMLDEAFAGQVRAIAWRL